jgi:tetratricopeptide (TPR) repeat protein/FMN phosphatase YigB (HAD superfamily)
MLAAGLPCVGFHGENTRFDLPDAATVLAEPTARAIKTALRDLLADGARRQRMAEAGPAFMANRTDLAETRQFVAAVQSILRNPARFAADSASLIPIYQAPPTVAVDTPDPQSLAPKPSLVTYDIWDTVLRRRCHPDEIKLHTARYLLLKWPALLKPHLRDPVQLMQLRVQCERSIGERERANGHDDEYGIAEVFHWWLSQAAGRPLTAAEIDSMASDLVAAELRQESLQVYADPQFPAFLDKIGGRKFLFASDFYLPADAIRQLLVESGARLPGLDGISSCDCLLNKRSGRLFRHAQSTARVPPGEHLHIGDNEFSDVFVPRLAGVRSVHYWNPPEERRREALRQRFNLRLKSTRPYWQELAATLRGIPAPADWPQPHRALFELGTRFAPIFFGFALQVAEQALLGAYPAIYFLTREGEFFQQLYRALDQHHALGLPLPPSHLLEVSRLATFAASVSRPTPEELMRVWTLYSTQSMAGLLRSFDLDPDSFTPLLNRHHLTATEEIQYPWQDKRVRAFLADPEAQQRLAAHCLERRSLLKAYLAARGLDDSCPRAALVDIGWRGTIQDNLARVLPTVEITGFYLALHRFLNPQPENTRKRAFGPNANLATNEPIHLLEFVSPIEMLCNSNSGSVLRYSGTHSAVVAERDHNPTEDAVFEQSTRFFQAGVLATGPIFADFIRCHALGSAELRPFALELLGSLVESPPTALAQAYFGLNHNETFGLGRFENKQRHLAQADKARSLQAAGDRDAFHRFLTETTWPQGFLRLCGLGHHFNLKVTPERASLPPAHHAEARACLSRAAAALQRRDWAAARSHALRSLALWPYQVRAHTLLFHAELGLGRRDRAMQHFAVLQTRCPGHPPTLNELAVNGTREGFRAEPLELWTELLEKNPTYRPAVLNLARTSIRDGDHEAAARLLTSLLERKPGDADAAALAVLATVGTVQAARTQVAAWLKSLDSHPARAEFESRVARALGTPQENPSDAGLIATLSKVGQISLDPASDLDYLHREAAPDAVARPLPVSPGARPPRLRLPVQPRPAPRQPVAPPPPTSPLTAPPPTPLAAPPSTAPSTAPPSPQQPDLNPIIAHLNNNQPAEALDLIASALRLSPNSPRLNFGRALALARLGRFAEAAQTMDLLPEADRAHGRLRLLAEDTRRRVSPAHPAP